MLFKKKGDHAPSKKTFQEESVVSLHPEKYWKKGIEEMVNRAEQFNQSCFQVMKSQIKQRFINIQC